MTDRPFFLAAALPSGPAYTAVLLCHVAAVLVGMVTMVAGAAFSARLLAAGDRPLAPSVRSYFSPGVNWVGRVLYLVPVFGAVLLGLSGGVYRPGAAWVLAGIGLWVVAVGLGEGVLWPAEQRVRRALAAAPVGPRPGEAAAARLTDAAPVEARQAARRMLTSSLAVFAVLVAGTVVMVAKP